MLTAFNYDQLYLRCYGKWEIWKFSGCSKQLQTTAEFASNLTPNICLLLAMQTLSDLTSKRPSFFPVDLVQVFYEIFIGRKSLFHFLVIEVFYTFLQE